MAMRFFSRHCLPITFTIDDNIWVSSEKEACSVSFSYVEVHWLKLAPGLKKVPGGKTTPHYISFGPILPKFEEIFEIGDGDFERCSMLPVRKTSPSLSPLSALKLALTGGGPTAGTNRRGIINLAQCWSLGFHQLIQRVVTNIKLVT